VTGRGAAGRSPTAARAKAGTITAAVAVAALIGYGVWTYGSTVTSQPEATQVYGWVERSSSPPVGIADALAGTETGPVTITGKVVEMGPTMGCWLIVDDGTATMMVQTDPMAYVPPTVQDETITATGRIVVVQGGMGYSDARPALLTTGISVGSGGAPAA
jgi:hypothetical protein